MLRKKLLRTVLTLLLLLPASPVRGEAVWPEPFVSADHLKGQSCGVYLPSDPEGEELAAALLLRADLGAHTYQEDTVVLGTFDRMEEEHRADRVVVGTYPHLPEEIRKMLPASPADGPTFFSYQDDEGEIQVVTGKDGEAVREGAEELIQRDTSFTPTLPEVQTSGYDLSLWPFPLRLGNTWNNLLIVLPDEVSNIELNLLGRVLAMKEEGSVPTQGLAVCRASTFNTMAWEGNLLVIGSFSDNTVIGGLQESLILPYTKDGSSFADTAGVLEGFEDTKVAAIQLVPLSEGVNGVACVISGTGDETLLPLLSFLRKEENCSFLSGNLFVVDEGQRYRAAQAVYEVGAEEKEQDWQAAVVTGVCLAAIVLVCGTAGYLGVLSRREKKEPLIRISDLPEEEAEPDPEWIEEKEEPDTVRGCEAGELRDRHPNGASQV